MGSSLLISGCVQSVALPALVDGVHLEAEAGIDVPTGEFPSPREPIAMDWPSEARRIRNEEALESEVIAALLNAPPEHLAAVIEATLHGVRSGYYSITPYDWRPAMARLRTLNRPWPGPTCTQCGSPLGDEDSNNNYAGMCWFCNEA